MHLPSGLIATVALLLSMRTMPAHIDTPREASIEPAGMNVRRDSTPMAPVHKQADHARVAVGKPAPPLPVWRWLNVPATDTSHGRTTTFGDGHVYVLDFTANWCVACPTTYPVMDTLRKQFGAKGLRILYVMAIWGMTGQSPEEEFKATRTYVTDHHLSAPVAVVEEYTQLVTSGYFGLTGTLPMLILVDGAGTIRALQTGTRNLDRFTGAVSSVMAAHVGPP